MIAKYNALTLLVFSSFAAANVTWVNGHVSSTAITSHGVMLTGDTPMTFKNGNMGAVQEYQTFCSLDQNAAASDSGSGLERGEIGDYTVAFSPTQLQQNVVQASSSQLGSIGGVGINKNNYTIYCVIHAPEQSVTDKSVTATGVIYNAELATVPKPTITTNASSINLGSCKQGDSLDHKVPLQVGYKGYGPGQHVTLQATISNASSNPDNSVPTLKVNNNTADANLWNLSLDQGPYDPALALHYTCGKPGNYSWAMVVTYTIE